MYGIVAAGAVLGAIINWFLKDAIIITSTGITGSYLIVAGIGYFGGGFPSIMDIYNMIQNKTFEVRFLKTFIAWLEAVCILRHLCCSFNHCNHRPMLY